MNKKDVIKYIRETYGVETPTDVTEALKDLLGDTIQEMMDAEFENHIGYEKYEHSN